MSFFTDSNGEEIEQGTEYVTSGIQSIIPAGTQLLVAIASSEWTEPNYYNDGVIKIGLHVVERGPYKNHLVYDNLKVTDIDSKKRDRVIKKLLTYDTLCKGMLAKADKAGKSIDGDTSLLERALNGGELMATFDVWEMERPKKDKPDEMEIITGNWIRAIGPKPKKLQDEDKSIKEKAKSQSPVHAAKPETITMPAIDDFDDDIPF
jgi:hypothetical protein